MCVLSSSPQQDLRQGSLPSSPDRVSMVGGALGAPFYFVAMTQLLHKQACAEFSASQPVGFSILFGGGLPF